MDINDLVRNMLYPDDYVTITEFYIHFCKKKLYECFTTMYNCTSIRRFYRFTENVFRYILGSLAKCAPDPKCT